MQKHLSAARAITAGGRPSVWMPWIPPPLLAGPPGDPDVGAAQVAPWSVRPRQFRDFLRTIFDRWVRREVGDVFVQAFDAALSAWVHRRPGVCVFAERCGDQLVLEHTSDLYRCDHYVYPGHRLGNILATPLAELARSPSQAAFGAAKADRLPGQCRRCRFLFACNGGCPKHRFARTSDGEPGLSYLCEAYRGFFAHAERGLAVMARLFAEGQAPARIMELLAREDGRRRFAAAGRNDPCPCGSGRKLKHCCGR